MAWHIIMVQQNLRPLNLGALSLNSSQELRYNNSCLIVSSNSSFRRKKYIIKVRKRTKIRKRFNQVPHLTQDTTWESNKNIPCISQTIIAITLPLPADLEINDFVCLFGCFSTVLKEIHSLQNNAIR